MKTITATAEQIEDNLQERAIKALLAQIGKNPGFFKAIPAVACLLPIWEKRAAELLHYVGFLADVRKQK